MEIFLSLSLITLCLIPLTELPHTYFIKEIKTLKKLELARTEEVLLIDVMKDISSETIASITKRKDQAVSRPTKPIQITIDGISKYTYYPKYKLWQRRHREDISGNEYRILHCEFSFTTSSKKPSFKHTILIKHEKEKSDNAT